MNNLLAAENTEPSCDTKRYTDPALVAFGAIHAISTSEMYSAPAVKSPNLHTSVLTFLKWVPIICTVVSPYAGPLFGEIDEMEIGDKYVKASALWDESIPLKRTSSNTVPGYDVGAVQLTKDSECHVTGTSSRDPNAHIAVATLKEWPSMNICGAPTSLVAHAWPHHVQIRTHVLHM